MREFVLLMVCVFVVVGVLGVTGEFELVQASPFTDIDVNMAYSMVTNGSYPDLVLLDVRTKGEYDSGHLYGAVWIPVTELEARIEELAGHEEHEVMVYCLSGGRSANASGILDMYNFTKVYNMVGGILAWESEGYPTWIATVHNLNSTIDYDTIQAAINANQTLDGHTIFVEEGIYYENVVVNKTVQLIGGNPETTIIDGNGTQTIFKVTSQNVNIIRLTVQNGEIGVYLTSYADFSIIAESNVINNNCGIFVESDDNLLTANNIVNSKVCGIEIFASCECSPVRGNTVTKNRLLNNSFGIQFIHSRGGSVYHNNFVNNTEQVITYDAYNTWDNGYPSGGNYWSDYEGNDTYSGPNQDITGSDGLGDTPYLIDIDNQDNYPVTGTYSDFNATSQYHVQTICNSTISNFQFNYTAISFNVTGEDGTMGFCRTCIPRALINDTYRVFVNRTEVSHILLPCSNSTYSYLYFSYPHSSQEVVIIPEFPSFLILPLFMIATLLIVIVHRRNYCST